MHESSSFFHSLIDPLRYRGIDSVMVVIHASVEVEL